MVELVPPDERICERCGRHEAWSDAETKWVLVEDDGERKAGDVYCLHEWDINGDYNPIAQ